MQLREAKRGEITPEMKMISREEEVPINQIQKGVASGRIVIPRNNEREEINPIGIGEGLKIKINANVGTSPDYADIEEEVEKAKVAEEYGADTIMDLSTGGDVDKARRKILKAVNIPVGTVPIYQAGLEEARKGNVVDMTSDDIFNSIRKHAEDGADFVTVHCGVTKSSVEALKRKRRLMDVVSRGGSFLAAWILHHDEENPLYDEFDYLLELAQEFDLTLSLGDGMRPGCITDASDPAQIQELLTLGELVEKARDSNVQTIVEGPGHLPLDHVEANVKLEKSICKGAPFYVLGPIVTDIAPGYDHLVGAIGGALAAWMGADYLCYVTPSEHLCLPSLQDVKEGVIASKIAAHAADIARGINKELDEEMSTARRDFDWSKQFELSVNPEKAKKLKSEKPSELDPDACSMCSELCALKMVRDYLEDN
ncbi:MAG: phosphomethylpyrimidine synthase [Hadesarchaea archaeon]|nr:phosphomethylpyrimidine synthase [Hadesarchaea archaeon]